MRTKVAVAILLLAILSSSIVMLPMLPVKAAGGTQLYINPAVVNKTPSDVGTNFVVNVTLSNFANLMGFDINLTWNSSLISFVGIDYATALNALWGAGNWAKVFEQSGAGFCELAAASTSTAVTNLSGASVLFTVTFHVDTASTSPLQTQIHFALVKLSDNATPVPNPIPATATDGSYTMSALYQVTFNETGVGSDFAGTVVTVDGTNYSVSGLPVSFWWNQSSVHNFTFASPLNVGSGEQEQYFWATTTGLSNAQSGQLNVTGSGSITGNYVSMRVLAITATAGGTTNPAPGTWTYLNGPVVTVTASPNTGYYFDNWVLDNVSVGSANPIQVLMNAPHQLEAVFGLSSGGYTLTITATAGGGTSPSPGNHNYSQGTVVTITASPSTGYVFDHWLLDGSNNGTASSTQVTMNTNHLLTAFFTPLNYTLTVASATGGATSPSAGSYAYSYGTLVNVTALPNTGYVLYQWVFDNVSVGVANPIQVLINANHQLTAFFLRSWTLNITVNGPGATNPSQGAHTYPNGTVVTATASPGTGYAFDHWLLDGSNNGTANSTQVLMNADHQLQAFFTPQNYTLTIAATTNGTTSPSAGSYTYSYGTLANVTALPGTGYKLDHWALDNVSVGSANPIQVLINANHQLQVFFSQGWTLNITVNGMGTTNPSQGVHTYPNGTVVTATASPGTGYAFDHWLLDGTNNGTANSTQVLMNADHQLQAFFTPQNYTLNITATTGGNTTPPTGSYTYSYGTVVNVTASVATGYIFTNWLFDNISAGAANPISITMNATHQLQAVFTPPNYTLIVTPAVGGTTSPLAGNHTYLNGTIVSIAASPIGGYVFDHWLLDGNNNGSASPIQVLMTTNHQLTPVFTSPSYTITIEEATQGSSNSTIGGSTTPAPGNYTCSYGTIVAVTASPSNGYFLEYWLLDGNNNGSASPIQVPMNTNHQLTAVFATLNYQNLTITVTATAGGSTNPLPGIYTCSYQTVTAFTASPDPGYYFDHWLLDGISVLANPIQVLMTTNHQLVAVFKPLSYTLAIAITGAGTTIPLPGNYTYSYGTVANVNALPNTGYGLDHWVLDGVNVGASNPIGVLINATRQLTAFFAPLNYSLSIIATTNGVTSPSAGNYSYSYGTVASVTALPNTGYGLDHWVLDGVNVGASNPISITMNGNHQLQGVFAVLTYTLAITATTGGNTNPGTGSHTYSFGTVVSVSASPSTGYLFDHWVLDGNNNGSASSTQVTMNANHQLGAFFTPLNYTLTIAATAGGTTNPAAGTWTYSYGTVVAVAALPNTGYGLDHWVLDGVNVGTTNPIGVLINTTRQLTAVFVQGYTLAITVTAGGATSPVAGNYTYPYGTVVTVNASSSTGYIFDHWTLDGNNVGTTSSTQVTMNANHQLKAFFTPLNYTLTITVTAGGTTNPSAGSYTYSYGTVASVTALPNTGYVLDHWVLNNVSAGAANPISITMNANHQLQAVFALFSGNYTLTITTTAGGATSPAAGVYTYSPGTVVTITASPYTGYHFDHWELDGNNVGATSSTQVTMNANHQLKAFLASPLQAPAVWITPYTLSFDTGHNHVGDRFNVTVWINTTGPSYAWQVQVDFNVSQINAVRAGYTGVATSLFFAGHSPTVAVAPIIDDTTGFVLHGESLQGIDQVAAGSASLFWIEFTIMAAPAGNETLTSVISVDSNPDKTFILDSDSNNVPNVGMGSATYTLSPQPPVRDVAVTNLSLSSYSPKQGKNITISVVVLNNGTIPETFDVTITLDSTPIVTLNIAQLQPGNSTTLTFEWNTTAGAVGRHTMTASATVVPFDTDPTNNSKSKTVTIISPTAPNTDLNGDGKVDMIDIAIVARAFGTHAGDARWNPVADILPDGVINMIDIAIVARDFGKIL